MKFVCDRCQTRYSIADEKVRQKILKIRCKTCDNVITVRDHLLPESAVASRVLSQVPAAPASPAPAGAPVPPPLSKLSRPPAPPRTDPGPVEWFIAINGTESGPFHKVDVAKKVHALKPDDEAYVWKEGFDGWKEPKDVPEIAAELAALTAAPSARKPNLPPPPKGSRAGVAKPVALADLAASARSVGTPTPVVTVDAAAAMAPASFDDERTAIQSVDAALLAAGEAAKAAPKNGSHKAPPSGLPPSGLEALDFGTGAAKPASFFPPPAVAAAGAPGSAPVAGPSSSAVMSTLGQSGLSKLVGLGFFQRNPAMKYVALGGVVVGLLVVIAIASMTSESEVARKEEPKTAPKPAAAEDPEKIAQERARQFFPDSPPEPARIGPATGGNTPPRQGLTRRPGAVAGKDHKDPTPTAPPPVGTAPPPAQFGSVDPGERPIKPPTLQERQIKPQGPSAGPAGPSVSQQSILAVVTKNRDSIKSCYDRVLRREGSQLRGKAEVTISIGASGKVKSVSVSSSSDLQAISPCMKQAISRWIFPASNEEYAFTFPLVLQQEGS